MKIFFEAVPYQKDMLESFFIPTHGDAIPFWQNDAGKRMISGVGYCFDKEHMEHLFILPKNFVFGGKAFGCLDLDLNVPIEDSPSLRTILSNNGWSRNILNDLPIYIYRAIEKYRKQCLLSITADEDSAQLIRTSRKGNHEVTLLDTTIALIDFYHEHKDLVVLVYKLAHSGFNKVLWSKTIHKVQPYINGEGFFYPYAINKHKTIDYDEELIVTFLNTLRYINKKFGFSISIDEQYNLVPDRVFSNKLERGAVSKRLKAIKNNYYNEQLLQLWTLLSIFADTIANLKVTHDKPDYLFIKDFEIVFERMIDSLISDFNAPDVLINQRDRKRVDHLFRWPSITSDQLDIFYIGDSKYYKDTTPLSSSDLYKQFTYAKNIIQTEIDWFYSGKDYIKYRDGLTEGYNIIPNFFISGYVESGLGFTKHGLKDADLPLKWQFQYPNRLFDRDTLFLKHFDVNLLFVLNAYASGSESLTSQFKRESKTLIKNSFISLIEAKYDFYLLRAKDHISTENAIKKHFWELNGKVFSPYEKDSDYYGLLMMGLEKNSFEENLSLILSIEQDFIVKEYHLGTEPYDYYNGLLNGIETSRTLIVDDGLITTIRQHKRESAIIYGYNSEDDLSKILENRQIIIPIQQLLASSNVNNKQQLFTSSFLFLHNRHTEDTHFFGFMLTGVQRYNQDNRTLTYEIDSKIEGSINLRNILEQHPEIPKDYPFFLSFAEVDPDCL